MIKLKTINYFLIFNINIFLFLFLPNIGQAQVETVFIYGKHRLENLDEEQSKAIELKSELKNIFLGKEIPISANNWSTIVNSYIYGNYPPEAIVAAIVYGGKTVHPTIPWSVWKMSKDYQEYLNKFLTNNQFNITKIVSVFDNADDSVGEMKDLTAQSAIVIDAKTGNILFAKDVDKVLPIASLTKLMSALVFLDHNPGWDKIVTYKKEDDDVLQYAEKREMAYLKISVGDQLLVKDLFYSGLVGSANNAIYALVRSTGLTREEFSDLMNQKAQQWNLKGTYFVEPSGLSPENVSTANDFAKIAYHAFLDENIRLATSYRWWEFNTINDKKYHKVKSINDLLKRKLDFQIRGTKTGYLEEAGRCLVAKGQNLAKEEIIALVLGGQNQNYFDEVEKLIQFGFEKK